MIKKEALDLVEKLVIAKQGIKMTELMACKELEPLYPDFDAIELVEQLIACDRLVEIEYTLPGMLNFRIKSFLLPGGTNIALKIRVNTERK